MNVLENRQKTSEKMLCAISGVPPKQPVVSPKSGNLFEFELIKLYIDQHHTDPISAEDLELDDLIHIKNHTQLSQPPREPTLNSIPALLSSLQNEYDSIALELFQLRKNLESTRKELSTALYHHDAAVRVAAKAIKERDEARKALEDLSISISGGNPVQAEVQQQQRDIEVGDSSIPEEVSSAITAANEELFAVHKASKKKVNVNVGHNFQTINIVKSSGKPYKKFHSASKQDKMFIITSATGISQVYDSETVSYTKDETIHKNKTITKVLITRDDTKVVGLQSGNIFINEQDIQSAHSDPIVAILEHPSIDNLVIIVDQSGLLSIVQSGSTIYYNKITSDATSADLHLDGALLAIGNKTGEISIVDLRSGEVAQSLTHANGTNIYDVKFGFNGYWLFTSEESAIINVWDLRKNTCFTINTKAPVTSLSLDKSSQLILGINANNKVELLQYNKSGKDWINKGEIEVSKEQLVDSIVIEDNEADKLVLDFLTATSEVQRVEMS